MKNTQPLSTKPETRMRPDRKKLELAIWTALIVAINLPLLAGNPPAQFIFDLQLVKMGQWWRIITYPLAHVSIYHLLMDASAFLMIYAGLEEKTTGKRLLYTAGCSIGSLLFSLLCSSAIGNVGLSGLSGTAHGLMAVTALELLKNHPKKTALFRTGVILFAVVAVKSIIEVLTGEVIFSSLHLGSIGTPVVESHLGGVMGGVLTFLAFNLVKNRKLRAPS